MVHQRVGLEHLRGGGLAAPARARGGGGSEEWGGTESTYASIASRGTTHGAGDRTADETASASGASSDISRVSWTGAPTRRRSALAAARAGSSIGRSGDNAASGPVGGTAGRDAHRRASAGCAGLARDAARRSAARMPDLAAFGTCLIWDQRTGITSCRPCPSRRCPGWARRRRSARTRTARWERCAAGRPLSRFSPPSPDAQHTNPKHPRRARQFLPLLLFGGRARRRNRTGSHDATTGYDPYACAATCSSQMGVCAPTEGAAFLELMEPAAPTPAILAPLPYAAMWPQGSGFQGVSHGLAAGRPMRAPRPTRAQCPGATRSSRRCSPSCT